MISIYTTYKYIYNIKYIYIYMLLNKYIYVIQIYKYIYIYVLLNIYIYITYIYIYIYMHNSLYVKVSLNSLNHSRRWWSYCPYIFSASHTHTHILYMLYTHGMAFPFCWNIWGFPKPWWYCQMDGVQGKMSLKWMIQGHHLWKHPYCNRKACAFHWSHTPNTVSWHRTIRHGLIHVTNQSIVVGNWKHRL